MPPFQLTTQQTNFLMIGIGVAVAAYVLWKCLQWLFRRRTTHATARMRPKHRRAQSGRAPQKASAEPLATAMPEVDSSESRPAETAGVGQFVHSSTTGNGQQMPPALGSFWSVEPKESQKQNLFEDAGVEYPYATEDDYRYGSLTPAMAELLPASQNGKRESRRLLRNAGYFEPHAWENFAAGRYLAIILPLLFFGILLVISPAVLEPYLMGGLIIGPALGWALPALFLRSRATERMRQIENAMPDMLDLLNMCVSQGMTVINSLGRISREFASVYPALAKELQIVSDQARVGNLGQALTNFSDRVNAPEVHSFTSLLIQTERMGTSVSEALEEYSDGMRESQRQRSDEKANSATFKLLFPTVLCLMPAVFLLLMGPAMIELNQFFSRGGVDGLNRQSSQFFNDQAAE